MIVALYLLCKFNKYPIKLQYNKVNYLKKKSVGTQKTTDICPNKKKCILLQS